MNCCVSFHSVLFEHSHALFLICFSNFAQGFFLCSLLSTNGNQVNMNKKITENGKIIVHFCEIYCDFFAYLCQAMLLYTFIALKHILFPSNYHYCYAHFDYCFQPIEYIKKRYAFFFL